MFLHIYKVHIHKSNYTKFYAIMLKNIAAVFRNNWHILSISSACDVVILTTTTSPLVLQQEKLSLLQKQSNKSPRDAWRQRIRYTCIDIVSALISSVFHRWTKIALRLWRHKDIQTLELILAGADPRFF